MLAVVIYELCDSGTSMPKKRGRGRPKGSQAENFQKSVHSDLNSRMNPSKIVEVGLDSEEPQDAGMVTR